MEKKLDKADNSRNYFTKSVYFRVRAVKYPARNTNLTWNQTSDRKIDF